MRSRAVGMPKPSQLAAARLGDHPFPHRQWSEQPCLQIVPKPRQELLLRGEDRLRPKPVDPRRPFPPVAPDPSPRHDEDRRVTHEVEQVIEPAIRIIDRPLMQLDLDPQYLRLGQLPVRPQHVGIHRRSPTLQSLDCELAAALRHVTGFPGLGLLRRLRHIPGR